ncbi:MAG: hypothetical protein H7240_00460 [Glaciimonas sp.]|nr:hypothetical protein [Glaciimonas sp.]
MGRIRENSDESLCIHEQKNHTAESVVAILRAGSQSSAILPPEGFLYDQEIKNALDVFIGYLMFDAWIANQDKQSENWPIILADSNDFLAPSYDHGSSLARNKTDLERDYMMVTKDAGAHLEKYITKARSFLFSTSRERLNSCSQ